MGPAQYLGVTDEGGKKRKRPKRTKWGGRKKI